MRQPPLQYALIWHSYLLGAILGVLAPLWPLPATLSLLLLAAIEKRLWHWQRLALFIIIFALAYAWADHALDKAHDITLQKPEWGQNYRFCGKIESAQGITGNKIRVLLKDVAPPGKTALPGLCSWTWEAPLRQPVQGQTVCLSRKIKPVSAFANFAPDSYLASLFSQDIFWRVWSRGNDGSPLLEGDGNLLARLRDRLRTNFLRILEPNGCNELQQSRAILMALLFGDRQFLTQKTTSEFASATLAHSLALSGQHLAVAGLIGMLLVASWSFCRPGIYLAQPRRIWIALAAVPIALLYLWIGDLQPSLLRAAAMLCIGALWLALGRSFSGMDLLCAALLAILICQPLAIFNSGLQMSALCVAVILISWPAIARFLPEKSAQGSFRISIAARLKTVFVVSLVIQLALLPLTLARFQLAGFWFPLNLIWLPVLGVVVLPCAFAALSLSAIPAQICEILARTCAGIAAYPCQLLLDLLDFLKQSGFLAEPAALLPAWPNLIAFALLACAAAWVWGNRDSLKNSGKPRLLLCLALCLLAIPPLQRLYSALSKTATIEALDVGQGQAILVTLPDSIRILIDGGGSYFGSFDPGKLILAPILGHNSAPALGAVINTHPDLDHLGGLFHVLDIFRVSWLFHNGREAQDPDPWLAMQNRHGSHVLASGDTIFIGNDGWRLEVLSPCKEMEKLNGNAASLVLRLVRNDVGIALFPGDATKESLRRLLEAKPDCQARLVFAPHHGSDKNFLPAFYTATAPEAVIACCGFMNRWHYPGKKLRDWLASHDIPHLDTGKNGRITATLNASALKITTIR